MIQTGVVIFSLPQLLARHFGTNGWIALIIFSIVVSLNIFLISIVFQLGKGRSIFEILEQSISKFILFPLYLSLICIWAMLGCLVAKEYVLIFQLVAFPTTNPMIFMFVVSILAFLLTIKGIYNISKASMIFFWLTIWMILLLFFFYGDFKWARLTPFIFQDSENMIKGFFNIYTAFLGYELSLLLFNYSDKKTNLIKATFWGNMITTSTYLYVCFISFGFLSFTQLKVLQFPLLDLLAYIKFPFVERVENLFYGFFMFTMIITMVMYSWSAAEVSKRIFPKLKSSFLSFIIVFSTFGVSFIPDVLSDVQMWLRYVGYMELGIAFGLPIGLILLLLIQRKKGEKHG